MYKTESFKPDTFKPARFESDGKITLSGKEIPYHTICEDNVIYGPDGNPVASIFTYAYFRSDVEDTSNRPVVFAYNGGPGSSCMYVQQPSNQMYHFHIHFLSAYTYNSDI